MLSRKYYQEVVKILVNIPNQYSREWAINRFIQFFKEDNPRFNEIKFVEACKRYDN